MKRSVFFGGAQTAIPSPSPTYPSPPHAQMFSDVASLRVRSKPLTTLSHFDSSPHEVSVQKPVLIQAVRKFSDVVVPDV